MGSGLGPVSGLLFIAATADAKQLAFDKLTGEELFAGDLPSGGFATPIVYEAGGPRFVVIGDGGVKGGVAPDSGYVAFAMPVSPDRASRCVLQSTGSRLPPWARSGACRVPVSSVAGPCPSQ